MVDAQRVRGQNLSGRADNDDDDDDDYEGHATILTKNTPPSTFRARLPVTFSKMNHFINYVFGFKKILESVQIPTNTMQFLTWRCSLGLGSNSLSKLCCTYDSVRGTLL